MSKNFSNKIVYTVIENISESDSISTIRLAPKNAKLPVCKPGQYISVYFPDLNTPEGKAYSISDILNENEISITVLAIGQFSRRLCAMKKGESLSASTPYGYFYSESTDTNLIMIAGGIGVTPFRSIIKSSIGQNQARNLALYYSSRKFTDLVFKREFDEIHDKNSNFSVKYFVTRESSSDPLVKNSRMSVSDILPQDLSSSPNFFHNEYMICGSIPFVRDFWKGLREKGIPEELIYTEAFFSH